MGKLEADIIGNRLPDISGWILKSDCTPTLQRTFTFSSYSKAISFVNAVAESAEIANHHPEMIVGYSKVVLNLTTHDVGGITNKDFELAIAVNSIYRP